MALHPRSPKGKVKKMVKRTILLKNGDVVSFNTETLMDAIDYAVRNWYFAAKKMEFEHHDWNGFD